MRQMDGHRAKANQSLIGTRPHADGLTAQNNGATTQQVSTLKESTEQTLQIISKTALLKTTPEQAFVGGLNVRKALRICPEATRATLLAMIADLCRFVDAKRTLTTDGDLIFAVETILQDFPALTVQEFKLICDGIKQGRGAQLYERLKVAEIAEAIRQYEGGVRAEILERRNRAPVERGTDNPENIIFVPQSMQELLRKRWFEKFKRTTTNDDS